MWIIEPVVQTVYLTAIVLALGLTGSLYLARHKQGAISLAITTLFAAFWAFGLLLSTVEWDWLAIQAMKGTYLGVGMAIAALFVFTLEYTGRERYITRTTLALLSIHPILVTLVAITNPHSFFFRELDPTAAIGVEQVWGPGFWIHAAYSYVLGVGAIVLLLAFLARTRRTLYRGQVICLVLGLVAVPSFNTLFLAGVVEFDTTPLGLITMAGFFTVAIGRYQLADITPIAQETVIDTVRDGILVVDCDGYVVDSNPAAKELLGVEGTLIGSSIDERLSGLPPFLSAYEKLTDAEETTSQHITYGDKHIQVKATPITDDRDRHVGWLFLLQDVTERVRRERELEQQIEKLDTFASIVSHDLRNPINVARGFTQQARVTGELDHLDKTEDALERMEDIIEDVLALTREGQEVTDPAEVSLSAIAENAWDTVETGGAELEMTDNALDALVVADDDRLQRLFENLFRNSIEHGVPDETSDETEDQTDDEQFATGHRVTVDTREESGGTLTITVGDNGVGIPPEEREKVLEDGYTTGGTGLGLTIVQQIADAHGWELDVTESETGGAAFEFSGVGKPILLTDTNL